MAYIDNETVLSDTQALTGTSGIASTNVIDLGSAASHLGLGEPMCIVLTVDVAAAGTAPTLTVVAQTDSDVAFGSPADVARTIAIPGASLTAGAQFVLPIPPSAATETYLRAQYTQGGTTPTVTVSARLVPQSFVEVQRYYADNITIS